MDSMHKLEESMKVLDMLSTFLIEDSDYYIESEEIRSITCRKLSKESGTFMSPAVKKLITISNTFRHICRIKVPGKDKTADFKKLLKIYFPRITFLLTYR